MITNNERKALHGIFNSDFRDGDHPVGKAVWSWSGNPFDNKRTFSGVVASLVKKGMVKSDGEGEDACLTMLEPGWNEIKNDVGIGKKVFRGGYHMPEEVAKQLAGEDESNGYRAKPYPNRQDPNDFTWGVWDNIGAHWVFVDHPGN
jgi:hypothetical protein